MNDGLIKTLEDPPRKDFHGLDALTALASVSRISRWGPQSRMLPRF
jgi:hypothetical protein